MEHTLEGDNNRNVKLDGKRLDPRPSQAITNHSPDGFNWGYGGSGPAQLAMAVVLKLKGNIAGYQDFKWKVIAKIPMGKPFKITFQDSDLL
jgi:hypothetical protein